MAKLQPLVTNYKRCLRPKPAPWGPAEQTKASRASSICGILLVVRGLRSRSGFADKDFLRRWIGAGAHPVPLAVQRSPIRDTEVTAAILADLEKIEPRSRRFTRYFSIAHLHNAGLGDDELQTYRNALAKLI